MSDGVVEDKSEKAERGRSSIEWPYFGLDEAIKLTRAVLDAGGRCTMDQLAGEVKSTITSGAFRLKVQAAKTFGLLQSAQSILSLTDLGSQILDPQHSAEAKVTAFLKVPLYNSLYDTYKGKLLPPTTQGLEAALVHLGVAVKQRDKARQAFQRSAKEAGFFAYGSSKLVIPVITRETRPDEPPIQNQVPANSTASSKRPIEDDELHPFIKGLLKTLPQPGTAWQVEGRRKWLQSAMSIFDLIYEGAEEGEAISINIAH